MTVLDSSTVSSVTLSGGDLIATNTGTTASQGVRVATAEGKTTDKYYFEVTWTTITGGGNQSVGVGTTASTYANMCSNATTGVLSFADGSVYANGSFIGVPSSARSAGDVVCMAVDLDNRKMWFRIGAAGNWNGNASYNPATNTGGFTIPAGTMVPFLLFGGAGGTAGNVMAANFGATAFVGAVPSGFAGGWTQGTALLLDNDAFYAPSITGGASSIPWTPTALTTLKLWLKANDLTGSDGSAIATWPDASSAGNNATQGTSGNRPTLAVAHQNGLNTVRFTAANANYFTLPNAFTAFTEGAVAFVGRDVADPGAAGSQDHGFFHFGTDSQQNHYPYGGDSNIYDDFASNARKSVGNPTPSLAAYHVGGFRSKASDWRYFINGAQFFNTSSNTVAWRTNPSIGNTISAVNYLNGYLGEVVVLNEFASTSDWQKLEGYLAWKWGTVATLDATHPYKTAAPVIVNGYGFPGLVTDADTIHAPTAIPGATTLAAGLVTDSDAFYTQTIAAPLSGLAPPLFTDGDNVLAPAITGVSPPLALTPELLVDLDDIPTVDAGWRLLGQLLVDVDLVRSPHVETLTYLLPNVFEDGETIDTYPFFIQNATGGIPVPPPSGVLTGSISYPRQMTGNLDRRPRLTGSITRSTRVLTGSLKR